MKKLFPPMKVERPASSLIGVILCWVVAFFVVPFFLIPFASSGMWGSLKETSWVEIVYHILKTGLVLMFFKEFFADSFLYLQISFRECLGCAAVAVGLMIAVILIQAVPMIMLGMPIDYLMNAFPLVEMAVTFTPGYLAYVNPIFGTICLTVVTPISTCGLLYVFGFAPACSKKTWLGYLCVAVVALIPALISVMWMKDMVLFLDMYFLQLPVHLIACWSYQKTDNILTPIFALGMLNLIASLANVFLIP